MSTTTAKLGEALTQLGKVKVNDRASSTALANGKQLIREAKAEGEAAPAPPPTPAPPPPPVPVEPDIFHGTKLSDYFTQPKHTLSEVPAPDGSSETVFCFTVSGKDGTKEDPEGVVITDNPRGEMKVGEGLDPHKIVLPNEFWWSGAFYLPLDFPAEVPGWWNLIEGPYGKPYAGSPPVQVSLNGKNVGWGRNATGEYRNVWKAPYVRGEKTDLLLHVVQSGSKGSNGLVEMWLNGSKVCSAAVPTLDASNYLGPQGVYLQSYRQKGMFPGPIKVYHWPMKLGTTRASVGG